MKKEKRNWRWLRSRENKRNGGWMGKKVMVIREKVKWGVLGGKEEKVIFFKIKWFFISF